jgi:hypothetical protein
MIAAWVSLVRRPCIVSVKTGDRHLGDLEKPKIVLNTMMQQMKIKSGQNGSLLRNKFNNIFFSRDLVGHRQDLIIKY